MTEKIQAIHERSRGTDGAPRIHRELRAAGDRVGRKRVARLTKAAGLAGVCRRKGTCTTLRQRGLSTAPDLVERAFTAEAPDSIDVADVTYLPTWSGFLYSAVVLGVWSRRVVGWAISGHMRAELVLDALKMAVDQRHPEFVIHHSDHGAQYTNNSFAEYCAEAGVQISTGSIGGCYDNGIAERFVRALREPCLCVHHLRSLEGARKAMARFIGPYIKEWLLERHRCRTPARVRAASTVPPTA